MSGIKTSEKQNYKQYCSEVVPEVRGILTVYTFHFYDENDFFKAKNFHFISILNLHGNICLTSLQNF